MKYIYISQKKAPRWYGWRKISLVLLSPLLLLLLLLLLLIITERTMPAKESEEEVGGGVATGSPKPRAMVNGTQERKDRSGQQPQHQLSGPAFALQSSMTIESRQEPTPHSHAQGGECTYCRGEVMLKKYRAEYAEMVWARLAERAAAMSGDQKGLLQEACHRFSEKVLREWSFSESRPLLAGDNETAALRKELIEPLLK